MDVSKFAQAAFTVRGPYRHSDGSFKFQVILLLPSAVVGGVPSVIGTADVHVNNDKCCGAMGQALVAIAEQLPPELEKPSLTS